MGCLHRVLETFTRRVITEERREVVRLNGGAGQVGRVGAAGVSYHGGRVGDDGRACLLQDVHRDVHSGVAAVCRACHVVCDGVSSASPPLLIANLLIYIGQHTVLM